MRRHPLLLGASLALASLLPRPAAADQTLTFDGTVEDTGLDHEFIEFDVPAGIKEIQIDHDDLSDADILDWGLDAPSGFRGWGGGNSEPVIVGAAAASRSYLAGPLAAGKWRVVIGKAQLEGGSADYHVVVTLRDAPTLAPQPERAAYAPSPPLAKEARWYAGDFHVHSVESGDAAPSLEEIATFARAQGLDFVELSDHNTVSQLDFINAAQEKHPDFLFIPGVEYTTYSGHANGIGATLWVDHKLGQPGVDIAGAARGFRDQGALFSINHPLFELGDLCIGCAWENDLALEAIDAVEIATAGSATLLGPSTLDYWDGLCAQGRHLAAIGGSDDHTAGKGEGNLSTPIGTPATYVFAKDLSVASILEGIRDGRTVVKIGGVMDPMVELSSDVALEGDTVKAESATFRATITGGKGLMVRWSKNGGQDDEQEITSDPFEIERVVTAPGPKDGQDRYRVEVLRGGRATTITSHLWIEYKANPKTEEEDDEPSLEKGCQCAFAGAAPSDAGATMLLAGCALFAARRRARASHAYGRQSDIHRNRPAMTERAIHEYARSG
jgi:predicted metal-dependent phosphoesterase TrpH